MTLRYKVGCTICNQKYLMRISVGHSEKQSHIIECSECKTNMSLELLVNFQNISCELNCIDNCEEIDFVDHGFESNGEYIIRNLHPELLIPKEFISDGVYNPNIFEAGRLVEERKNKIGLIEESNLKITKDFISNLNRIDKNWDILKIAWKMKNNKQSNKLIEKQLQKYKSSTIKSDIEFDEIMFDFNNTILFPDFVDFTPNFSKNIREIFKHNNKMDEEYLKCIKYYKENLLSDNIKKFYDIYCDFFELYNDYKPFLTYITTSQEVNHESMVSSDNFEKTKMFYGKLFEAYTSNISFITMLHNIFKGRDFDKLENISFEKYLSTEKAARTENFKNTNEFKFFHEYIDSKLRNASHHCNIEIKDNIVTYKAGTPLKEYTMTYTKYLEMCTQLFLRFVILHQLQILKYYAYLKYNR